MAGGLRNDRNLATDWYEVTNVTVGYSVWGVPPWLDMRAVKTVDSGARSGTVLAVDEAERLQLLMLRYQQADRAAVTELVDCPRESFSRTDTTFGFGVVPAERLGVFGIGVDVAA